jgi:alpha-tubulin suppressor-like RCC1 family protein
MKRIVFAGLGVLVFAGCDRSPTTPPVFSEQPSLAAVGRGARPVLGVTAGEFFSCALTASGEAFCWGLNQFGALGGGDRSDALTPRAVTGGVGFSSVTAAGAHACALTPDGAAYCWGQNASGEAGSPTAEVCLTAQARQVDCTLQPAPVSGDLRFSVIDAGWRHNCGLTAQGEAYCWGWNLFGQLGAPTTETCLSDGVTQNPCSRTPVAVSGGLRFKSISAGFWQTCGIASDDQTYCWGNNQLGSFGNGTQGGAFPAPVPGAVGVTLRTLSSGASVACGITTDRITMCWGGGNSAGELGDGTNTPHRFPQPIVGDFVSVRSVNTTAENNFLAHVCGISPSGETSCWGSNRFGQLGVATPQVCQFLIITFTCSNVPVSVAGDYRFRSIAPGNEHTCGATTDGDVLCWGRNDRGQVGDGTTTNRQEPVLVALP